MRFSQSILRVNLCIFEIFKLDDMLCCVSKMDNFVWCDITYLLSPLVFVILMLSSKSVQRALVMSLKCLALIAFECRYTFELLALLIPEAT